MSGDSIGELKVKVKVEVDTGQAKAEIKQTANEAKNTWAQAADAMHERMASSVGMSSESFKGLLGGIQTFGAVAVGAVALVGHELLSMTTQIDRAARSLGLTVTEYQRLEYAAQAAGVESNDLLAATGQIAQKAADAASGGGAARLFDDLGISAENADGSLRSTNDLMLEASDALARLPEGSRRTAAAIQLFGDAGRKLVPVLGEGREGMQGLFNEFDALGGGVSEDAARKSREMEHALLNLKIAFVSAAQPIIETVLPALTSLAERLQPIIGNSHVMRIGLAAVGVAVVAAAGAFMILNAAMLPVILGVGLVAAVIVAVMLAVDDLIVTFEGGDSATRRLIDGLLGFGATTAIVETVTGAFEDLVGLVDGIASTMSAAASDVAKFWQDAWNSIPAPIRNLLERGASAYVGAVTAPFRAIGNALGSLAPGEGGTAGAVSAGANIDAGRILQNALAIAPAAPATVSATPGQSARAQATTTTASGRGGGRTVNANQRTQVTINGLVDPNQLDRVVQPLVERAMRQANEDTLDTLADEAP